MVKTGCIFSLLPCCQPHIALRESGWSGGFLWLWRDAAALPYAPVMQPIPPGQESAGTRWVSYVQMCSVFACERKKKSVPEEEWLRQTQPQIIYNASLIGTIYILSKILWQMSWKEQRKNFYETLVNSQRDFFFQTQSTSTLPILVALWSGRCYEVKVAQSCPTLCVRPWNSPGPRILEWVAIPFSSGSS